jgi:hypothetical protein
VLRGLLGLALIGLTVYALIDCVRTDSAKIKGLPKVVWVLLIVLVTPIGPIAWLVVGRGRDIAPSQRSRHPTAPDDDPDFLRRLDEHKRRRADEERLRQWEAELRERDQRHGDDGDSNRA